MAKILKDHEIDIVISAVGGANVLDQIGLVEAIKAVGTIKVVIVYILISLLNFSFYMYRNVIEGGKYKK